MNIWKVSKISVGKVKKKNVSCEKQENIKNMPGYLSEIMTTNVTKTQTSVGRGRFYTWTNRPVP